MAVSTTSVKYRPARRIAGKGPAIDQFFAPHSDDCRIEHGYRGFIARNESGAYTHGCIHNRNGGRFRATQRE